MTEASPLTPESPEAAQRQARIEAWGRMAAAWLLIQGLLQWLAGPWVSSLLALRSSGDNPFASQAGMASVALALALQRSLRQPENRGLAADLLSVLFWLRLILAMSLFKRHDLYVGEQFIALGDLVFGIALAWLRLGGRRQGVPSPGDVDAKLAAAETISRLKSLLASLGKSSKPQPRRVIPPYVKEGGKPISEAQPTMDD